MRKTILLYIFLLPFLFSCGKDSKDSEKETVVETHIEKKKMPQAFDYRPIKKNYLFADKRGGLYICDSCDIFPLEDRRFCCYDCVLVADTVAELKSFIDTNSFHKISQFKYKDKRHVYKLEVFPTRFPNIILIK